MSQLEVIDYDDSWLRLYLLTIYFITGISKDKTCSLLLEFWQE